MELIDKCISYELIFCEFLLRNEFDVMILSHEFLLDEGRFFEMNTCKDLISHVYLDLCEK